MRARCTRWCAGSASATATCRKARSAATPTFRCARRATTKLGTRCEIKNLNSFRFMEQAIEFEARRQIELLEDGGTVDAGNASLRSRPRTKRARCARKEDAQDYRYFPDPDLLPLVITEAEIDAARSALPELPEAKRERFDAAVRADRLRRRRRLPHSAQLADYFERAREGLQAPTAEAVRELDQTASWPRALNDARDRDLAQPASRRSTLAGILERVADGTLSGKTAKKVFEAMWRAARDSPTRSSSAKA